MHIIVNSGVVVITVYRKKVLDLNRVWDLSVLSLHVFPVSAYAIFECRASHLQSKDMHGVRIISDSKLTVGGSVSMNGCLSLCISPVTDWHPVTSVPRLLPVDSW